MNEELIDHINHFGVQLFGTGFSIQAIKTLHGGSVNQSYCLITKSKKYFIKLNDDPRALEMFEAEKKGLELLSLSGKINIPMVYACASFGSYSYLLMEFIETKAKSEADWETFGYSLAELHQIHHDNAGFYEDNFIGTLAQNNEWTSSWETFFIEQRLIPQAKLAVANNRLAASVLSKIDSLRTKLAGIFPNEAASLLHGDLWSGNAIVNLKGEVYCVDPSVYYGSREMDIAMAHLFGGFPQKMFAAYHERYPLFKGWESRIDLCNLYPLIVHVNLFGEAYANRFMQQLKKYL